MFALGHVVLAALAAGAPDAGSRPPTPVESYQQLLAQYVGADGEVDYAGWKAHPGDVARLDLVLGTLQRSPPADTGKAAPAAAERLGYWLNLYNALVVREILRHWPLSSVREVPGGDGGRASGEALFRELTFLIGDRRMTLDQIEHEVIRGTFQDARIHFAINCGSRSCPALKPEAFTGPRLQAQLDRATRAFVNDPANVKVDAAQRTVSLSQLFDWYRDDFSAFARSRRRSPDLLGFLELYADGPLAASLEKARAERYRLVFTEYDWSVNAGTGSPATDAGVGALAPAVTFTLLDGGSWSPERSRGKVVVLDFWATWCKPCRASFPKLAELYRAHRARGLEVVGVAEEPAGPQISAFLRQTGASFPICTDPAGAAQQSPWQILELPTEVVIDRRGVVRHRHSGAGDFKSLAAEVEALLAEP
jgi:thiol-disulfide isomerase/thioredoxin